VYELHYFLSSHLVDLQHFSHHTIFPNHYKTIVRFIQLQALKYTLELIVSRLISDGEVGTDDVLVSATNGVADLFVFRLFDGGFVGLYECKSAKALVLDLRDTHLITTTHFLLRVVDG